MKKTLSVLTGLCIAAFAWQASADGVYQEEAVPMAYLSIPFGGINKLQNKMDFGVGVARSDYHQVTGMDFMGTEKPRIVDLSFRGSKLNALYFNGVNTLKQSVVQNADGTTTTAMVFNAQMIVPAVVAGIVVAAAAESGDKEEDLCKGFTKIYSVCAR